MRALPIVIAFVLLFGCGSSGPSDEALLEQFVSDVTGQVDDQMVARALGYTDFEALPVDVKAPGHAGMYRAERAEEIVGAYKKGLRRFLWNSEIKVRSSRIEIEGDRADVFMRLFTKHGPLRAETALRKLAGGWKVEKVHLSRGL